MNFDSFQEYKNAQAGGFVLVPSMHQDRVSPNHVSTSPGQLKSTA